MNFDKIIPLLTLPKNWQWGEFQNDDGQILRYGWNAPTKSKALIVIAQGRTECIEEYFEIIHDFNAKGYACAVMDWQGQGLSYRHNNDNSRQHSFGFKRDVDEFQLFIDEIGQISKLKKLQKTLMAHSMGGNITLRYMASAPDTFKCAYLIAPMLGLQPKRIIKYVAPTILRAALSLKSMAKYAIGQSRWNITMANIAKYKVSNDPIRREKQPYLFQTRPELQCGGVTYGWLNHALQSIALLQKQDICDTITTPVFIAMGGKDIVVDNDKTITTASMLPHCETHVFEGAQHQIHAERDDIRDDFLKILFSFFDKHL